MPASPNANTTTIGNGKYASSFDGMQESTASPPILHRRLFVADGEPHYVTNPVDDLQAKHQPKTRKTTNGKGKANGHGKEAVEQGLQPWYRLRSYDQP